MDWTKAKTILILALLVTNLVLIFFIVDAYSDKEDEGKILQETIQYLESHGVVISADVPEKSQRMSTLTVKYRTADQSAVQEILKDLDGPEDQNDQNDRNNRNDRNRSEPTKEQIVELADTAVKAVGMMTESTQLDQVVKNEDGTWTVTYKDLVDGILIDNSQIRCEIADGKVVSLDWDWLEPLKFSKAKRKILPAAEALMNFRFELYRQRQAQISEREKTGEPAVSPGGINGKPTVEITGIEIVYWLNPEGVGTDLQLSEDTAYPTWKISYRKGAGEIKTMYVDAMGDLTK